MTLSQRIGHPWEAKTKNANTYVFHSSNNAKYHSRHRSRFVGGFCNRDFAAGIPVGSNFFETVPGLSATLLDFSREVIPRDFFSPGSDAFIVAIRLKGNPIDPATLGTTDTIMSRPEVINVVLGEGR